MIVDIDQLFNPLQLDEIARIRLISYYDELYNYPLDGDSHVIKPLRKVIKEFSTPDQWKEFKRDYP